jgi:transposase
MLHLDASTKYFWYHGTADFRKGFDGLCGLVKEHLRTDVTDGGVFIFLNRRSNAIKLLK